MAKEAWGRQKPVAMLLGVSVAALGPVGRTRGAPERGLCSLRTGWGLGVAGAACAEESRGRGSLASAERQDRG